MIFSQVRSMAYHQVLSLLAILISVVGVAIVTALDASYSSLNFISHLNEIDAQYQYIGNGLFMLIAVFWVGAIDSTRRFLEPNLMDNYLRFSAIAYAASYALSMVFPCDAGCPPFGSLNQSIHSTVVFTLYFGPMVFSIRLLKLGARGFVKAVSFLLIIVAVVMVVDSVWTRIAPGLLQRVFEILFFVLWWKTFVRENKTARTD